MPKKPVATSKAPATRNGQDVTEKSWTKIRAKHLYLTVAIVFFVASAIIALLSHLPKDRSAVTKKAPATGTTENPVPASALDQGAVDKILGRNIFNSEGKLGDWTEPSPEEKTVISDEVIRSSLPLAVKGLIYTSDPSTGLAHVENTNARTIKSFLVGDNVFDLAKLIAVEESRIIIDNNGQQEFVPKEEFKLVRNTRSKGKATPAAPRSRAVATGPPPETFREDGMERVGLNTKITDSYLEKSLNNLSEILQDAKAEPFMQGGEMQGFQLTRIRENSIYEKLGLRNGDVIKEINGQPTNDAAGTVRLLQQLRKERGKDGVDVRIMRGGQDLELGIQVQ